jgi:predicted site-specific integrase-resolvase
LKLLTTVDVSRRADLTTDAIRKAVRRGQLRAIRAESGVFIYREADVERWLTRRRKEAAEGVLANARGAA